LPQRAAKSLVDVVFAAPIAPLDSISEMVEQELDENISSNGRPERLPIKAVTSFRN